MAILESTITAPNAVTRGWSPCQQTRVSSITSAAGAMSCFCPKPGHCCVFCSYGTVVCPPMQSEAPFCGGTP